MVLVRRALRVSDRGTWLGSIKSFFARQARLTIGALDQVHWRRIRMYFRLGGQLDDLANPLDLLRFPCRSQIERDSRC
jgi:hypothetical protein